jgi:hypothetical protein
MYKFAKFAKFQKCQKVYKSYFIYLKNNKKASKPPFFRDFKAFSFLAGAEGLEHYSKLGISRDLRLFDLRLTLFIYALFSEFLTLFYAQKNQKMPLINPWQKTPLKEHFQLL